RRRGSGCISQRGGPAANRFALVFAVAADHLERDNQRDVQSSKFNGDDRYVAHRTSLVRILHEPRGFWHGGLSRLCTSRFCVVRYDAQRTSRFHRLYERRDFWHGKCTRRGSRRICDGGYVRALHRNSRSGSDTDNPAGFVVAINTTFLAAAVLSLGAVVASVT